MQYTLCILPGLIVAAELGDSFYIPMRVSLGPTVTSLLRNLCSCVLQIYLDVIQVNSSAYVLETNALTLIRYSFNSALCCLRNLILWDYRSICH